ncbi:FKBP-type peptidyl-prolyl cis-trans isomerase [Morganella morganii]|uniref:FKBP-type peptidyl-prolyl cis-trans isomerase n=1 Tax=Morganella morganii TaxID=582 RepID=UPI00339BEFBE
MQVAEHHSVLLDYTLKLSDGSVADSTEAQGKPALFRLGDGSLSDALEQQLLGLSAEDKKTFTLPGEAVFGKPSPDLIQFFSAADFLEAGLPETGTIMLFTAMNGSEMPGIIKSVTEDSVEVDFNHPLCGQDVTFDISVRDVTA